jgi:hypothetical protein
VRDTARLQQTPVHIAIRSSGLIQKKMSGWDGPLSREQTSEIAGAKGVIYDAFQECH